MKNRKLLVVGLCGLMFSSLSCRRFLGASGPRKLTEENIITAKILLENYRKINGSIAESSIQIDSAFLDWSPVDKWGKCVVSYNGGTLYTMSSAGMDRIIGTKDDIKASFEIK